MSKDICILGFMVIGGDVDGDNFYYDRLKSVVDKTVVFLDNSDIDVDADIVISMRQKEPSWNDMRNRVIASLTAASLDVDWVLSLDSDEDLDHRIQNREDLKKIINSAESCGCNAVSFFLREMWESHYHYRSDGIWGKKARVRLRKNPFKGKMELMKMDLSKKFHGHAVFPGSTTKIKKTKEEYEIYHYGCFTEELRRKRVSKYNRIDPEKRFQKIGYDYMNDNTNLEISSVIGKNPT